jgi:mannose-1-phosphate guanylyltransferase
MAHAAPHLVSDPFLVLNCDALIVPPIAQAVSFHKTHDFVATMVLVRSQVWPNVKIEKGRVVAILRGARDPDAYTFTGFHVVSRRILDLMPNGVFHDVRDTYDVLMKQRNLGAFVWQGDAGLPFLDIGTPEAYLEAHRICSNGGCARFGFAPAGSRIHLAAGFGYSERTANLGRGCRIEESIVLSGAQIEPGARIQRSIIGPGAAPRGDVSDRLVTTAGEREIAWP